MTWNCLSKTIHLSLEANILRYLKPFVLPLDLTSFIFFSKVTTINEKLTIGKISKYWSGFVNDAFTNADNFGIHVPADLDVTVKAAMIGACFLFVSMVLKSMSDLFPLACSLLWSQSHFTQSHVYSEEVYA